MTTHSMTLEGHIAPELEKTYFYIPFDMPAEAVRLDVTFRYSDRIGSSPLLSGGNTVDLGILDGQGLEFLEAGFRGWSGSERDAFFITESEATPGYLPGPLTPGRWNLLLGLYKLAPEGCAYHAEVTITTQPGHQAAVSPAAGAAAGSERGDLPCDPPPAPYAPWLRGELHCHTWHSDGALSPAELVARARQRGLDFLAVTDHNNTAGQRELETVTNPGLLLIRGVEVTTFKGHFNVWGIPDWVDFRVLRPEEMAAALEYANRRGGLTSCGHPKPFGPDWDYPEVTNHQCVEVWNGPWNGLNEMSLEYWLNLLAAGRRIPCVGGSDYHRDGEQAGRMDRDLGTPTNWVRVTGALTPAHILDAVRQGRVSLSDVPDGPFLELRGGPDFSALQGDALPRPPSGGLPVRLRCLRGAGCRLRLLDQRGVLYQQDILRDDVTIECQLPVENSLYVRAELRFEEDWMRALTNPIYLSV